MRQQIPCPKCGAARPMIVGYPEGTPKTFYSKCRKCDFRSADTPDPKLAKVEWSIAVKQYWDEKYPPLSKDPRHFFNSEAQPENRVSPSGVPIPDDRVPESPVEVARGSATSEQHSIRFDS